jgi:two-component sensor histidine kinase
MHSMTVLYDKLYRSSNVSETSIGDYIPPLVREIVRTDAAGSRIRLSMEVGDYVLPVPVLAGLGMLINELVTNAIKYAFPGNAKGTITVATTAREPGSDRGAGSGGRGRLRLVVADDGVGLPESVSLGDSAGFVLTLVSTLSAQHRFEVEVDRSQGTRFTIQLL